MDRVTIETLKHQLQEKAKECYRNGKPDQGDMIWSTFDVLEAWERQGLPGELPVDVAQFELATPSTEQIEAWGEHLREQLVHVREQFRREAQAAKACGNSTTAADKWRELLTIDPNDVEAQRELQWHAEAAADQPQRKMLNDLRRKANSELFSDLDEALRLAHDLLTSSVLDDTFQQEVERLASQARNKRSEVELASAEIGRMEARGLLTKAIAKLEDFLYRGRFEYEDRDGIIIPTSDKLREFNEEYSSFCTQMTMAYIERAESSLPAFPKSALKVLDEAWNKFDRPDPSVRDRLELRRIEVGELIDRWEAAQSLVDQANRETDPQARLAMYLDARSRYDGLPGIQDLIEMARRDAASAVLHEVKNIYARARLLWNKGEIEEAHEVAVQAREQAKLVLGASADLEAELIKVDQLIGDVAHEAARRRAADEAGQAIDEFLQRHDFRSADEVLALLPEDVRTLPAVKLLEDRIVRARGRQRIYQVARQRLDTGDFQGVLDLLAIPDSQDEGMGDDERFLDAVQLDERIVNLRRCAQARVYYVEGMAALGDDPAYARLCFDLAIDLDPQIRELVRARSVEADLDYQLAVKMHERLQRTRDDLDPPGELLALARVVRAVERYLAAVAGVDNSQPEAEDSSAEG